MVIAAWFSGCLPAVAQTAQALTTAEVTKRLSVLQTPTLENAVIAARELKALADSQQGEAKAATERLITEIRDLFYGEVVVKTAKEGLMTAESQAQAKERSAEEWMKPNVFGKTNPTGHAIALRDAQTLRTNAARQLAASREKLVEVVKATDMAIQGYDAKGQAEVGTILHRAMKSVVARSLQSSTLDADNNGAFNKEVLTALAVLGMVWWASSSGSFNSPEAAAAAPPGFDWNQQSRVMEQDAQRAEDRERERQIIERQQRAFAEEAERGAAMRAAAAEEAARARAAEAARPPFSP